MTFKPKIDKLELTFTENKNLNKITNKFKLKTFMIPVTNLNINDKTKQ